MNTWLDKYEEEPMPMWIEEFQDGNGAYYDNGFNAQYISTEDNGIDGLVHYFKIFVDYNEEYSETVLKQKASKFAEMFHYEGRGPGHLFCLRHSIAIFPDGYTGILRINEDYDN